MNAKELLKSFHSRLAKQGWIRAIICGLSVGFSLLTICSAAFLLFGVKAFWISLIVFAVSAAASTPIFYYVRYRKTTREVAACVDAVGLEERVLTMAEYENDDSYIARRQREDAVNAVKRIDAKFIKIAVSAPMIAICVSTFILGAGVTTASAVAEKSLIAVITENVAKDEDKTSFVEVQYEVQDDIGGRIEGEMFQSVVLGEDATPVQAVAEDEYFFAGWSDGYEDAYREDINLNDDLTVYAIFMEIEDGDEGEGEGEGEGKGEGEGQSGKGEGEPGKPGEGEQSGNEPGEAGDGAGGSSLANNQIVDGQTYYGDGFANSQSDAQTALDSNTDISGDESGTIGDYFHNIAK